MKETIREMLNMILKNENRIETIEYDTELVESGIIDSLVMAELYTNIEGDLGIELDVEDLIPENFKSIECIENMLKKYN